MTSTTSSTTTSGTPPASTPRKSKHALAKEVLKTLEAECSAENLDPEEGVEALLTLCIQDMQQKRGSSFTRDYLQYELSSLSSGDMYDVQKR